MKKAVLKNSVFLKTFIILSVITFLPLICISLFFSSMAGEAKVIFPASSLFCNMQMMSI